MRGMTAFGGVVLIYLAAAGCGARGTSAPPVPAAPAPGPSALATHITIEHALDRDAWRIEYRLPAPVHELEFVRPGAPPRAKYWKVLTPGLSIAGEPDAERIVSNDGQPFAALELGIETYEVLPEKDYQVFFSYTDGSRLVFTGQFDVRVPGSARPTFTFVPRPSEHVIVQGDPSPGPKAWTSEGDGTYACFGQTRPIVGDGFIGVVDAGLPGWLREPMESLLPALFRFYAEQTGVPLALRPAVYMSYRADPEPGRWSVGGGSLPRVLHTEIRLGSRVVAGPREGLVEKARQGTAHEVAHLWNGDMYHQDTPGGDWMPEGSADAFAYAAMRELGLRSDTRSLELEAEAFSMCLVGAALGPLHAASLPGRSKLYYWCGHLIAHLTDALARRQTPARNLFTFWGELFRAAPDGRYDEERYLSQLRTLPGGVRAEAAVRALLTGGSENVAANLLAAHPALVRATPDELPQNYHEFAGLVAAALVLRNVSGRDETPTWQLGGDGGRGGWRAPSADLVLAELEGHDLRRRGADAYDAATAACAARGWLDAGVHSLDAAAAGIVRRALPCPPSFPPRPPYVRPLDRDAG